MVGDSALDMQCAHAAGCRAVLVPWGYGHHTLPAGLDPLRVSDPDELLQVLLATRSTAEPLFNS
jgi:phosphoglycolate phosphatase-like HAD superfamily hydrolase